MSIHIYKYIYIYICTDVLYCTQKNYLEEGSALIPPAKLYYLASFSTLEEVEITSQRLGERSS
jgi:hypothetical protein